MADRDQPGVGEAGLARGLGLAVDHRDLVAVLEQLPGRGHADHARAHDDDVHGQTPQARAAVTMISIL